jgi:hypothetical protein|tara:strand:- start:520 stop:759 length:240 start_codon:yes stop_codon:yes gene_type:complete
MKNLITIALIVLFAAPALAKSPKNSKFYDFSDQIIDGEMKKPTALYIDEKQKVKFDRLLSLKRSFLRDLEISGGDPSLK